MVGQRQATGFICYRGDLASDNVVTESLCAVGQHDFGQFAAA
jgi:hypothetical protein